MQLDRSKRGRGAFSVRVEDDGKTVASLDANGGGQTFDNPQDAYDFYREIAEHNHAAWNICYNLLDVLKKRDH